MEGEIQKMRNVDNTKVVYRRWPLILSIPLISGAVFTLCFCGAVSAQREGGELRYGEMLRRQSKYDPIHRSTPLAHRIGVMVFNGLLTFDKDNHPIPQLTSLTKEELRKYLPKHGVIYQFPLRRDIQWHDEKPFTAYDVLFTYLAMKNSPTTRDRVDFIAEAKVLDDYTIEFALQTYLPNALGRLAFHIIPHHPFVPDAADVREDNPDCKVPEQHDFVGKPIGTGPYRFDPKAALGSGNDLHLLVNESYPILSEGRKRSYIDRVTMRLFSDEHTLANAVAFGSVDLAVGIHSTLVQLNIRNAQAAGRNLWIEPYQSLSYYFFALNQNAPFLGGEENQLVRQALCYATNRQEWMQATENGAGILISGPLPLGSPFADPSVQPYKYDIKKAKALLQKAGFVDTDGDGIVEKYGKPFRLTLKPVVGQQKEAIICQAFINNLRQVGIEVKSQVVATEEEWRRQIHYDHDFDVVLASCNFMRGAELYPLFHSTQAFPGGKNFISYGNSSVDITLTRLRTEPSPAAYQHLSREVYEMLHQACPYIFLWTPIRIAVGDAKIRNVQIHPDGFFDSITEWWIE